MKYNLAGLVNLNTTCHEYVNAYHDIEGATRDDICYSDAAEDTYVAQICPVTCGICPLCTAPPTEGPIELATDTPTALPTEIDLPTILPTEILTRIPTALPTDFITRVPTAQPVDTDTPTTLPTFEPTHYYINDTCCFDYDRFIVYHFSKIIL